MHSTPRFGRSLLQLLLGFAYLLAAPGAWAQTAAANSALPFATSNTGPEGGFGTQTLGGLEGRVVKVTNLNDSGPGSLRLALESLKDPRVVVFEVSGQIDLKKDIYIRNPYITVAGQTAPSPGITVTNATLRIITHDVVVQHLRFRVGNRPGAKSLHDRDAITLMGISKLPAGEFPPPQVYNVVIDHCSVSWSTDEGISAYFKGIRDVTVRNCIIAEPLDKAGHPKGGHSMALLIGDHTQNATILGNLFAHSRFRNPVFKGNSSGIVANNLMYDIGNNALHTYGAGDGGPTKVTAVANVLLEGPTRKRETKGKSAAPDFYTDKSTRTGGTNPGSQIYLSHNIVPPGSAEKRRTLDFDVFVQKPPVTLEGLRILPAAKVRDAVLARAGARPKNRDAVDLRIVEQVRTGAGRIIDTQDEVGGWPALAQNTRGLNPPARVKGEEKRETARKLAEWLAPFTQAVE